MPEPHAADEQEPVEDLPVDDDTAEQVTGGDDTAFRGRYQLRLGETSPVQPPTTSSP